MTFKSAPWRSLLEESSKATFWWQDTSRSTLVHTQLPKQMLGLLCMLWGICTYLAPLSHHLPQKMLLNICKTITLKNNMAHIITYLYCHDIHTDNLAG